MITVSLVDDLDRSLTRESWSPLGYEDLGNPNLFVEHPQGLLNNDAERNLLDRLRTSIDRSLMTFARRERRRFRDQEAAPTPDIQPVFDANDEIYRREYLGNFSEPEPIDDPEFEHIGDIARDVNRLRRPRPTSSLTDEQRAALIIAQPSVEEQRERATLLADQPRVEEQREQPVKARVRKVKRVSRYKRDPVI